MSRSLSKNVTAKSINRLTGWDAAIYDAQRAIESAKIRIETLTVSLHRFKQFKASGEPFPGEKTKQKRRKTLITKVGNRKQSLSGQSKDL
jgi:hypothetical protein